MRSFLGIVRRKVGGSSDRGPPIIVSGLTFEVRAAEPAVRG